MSDTVKLAKDCRRWRIVSLLLLAIAVATGTLWSFDRTRLQTDLTLDRHKQESALREEIGKQITDSHANTLLGHADAANRRANNLRLLSTSIRHRQVNETEVADLLDKQASDLEEFSEAVREAAKRVNAMGSGDHSQTPAPK